LASCAIVMLWVVSAQVGGLDNDGRMILRKRHPKVQKLISFWLSNFEFL